MPGGKLYLTRMFSIPRSDDTALLELLRFCTHDVLAKVSTFELQLNPDMESYRGFPCYLLLETETLLWLVSSLKRFLRKVTQILKRYETIYV